MMCGFLNYEWKDFISINDYGVTQGLGWTLEKIWALKTVDSSGLGEIKWVGMAEMGWETIWDWMRKDERRSNTRENIGWDGMGGEKGDGTK